MIDMFPEPATGKPAKAAKAVPAVPAVPVPAIPVAPPAGPDSPAENPEGLVSLASMLKPVSSIAREAANQVPLVRETFSEGALAGMARPPKPVDFSDIVGFGPQTAQDADIYRDFTRAAANNANNSGTYLDADNNPVPLSGSWYDTFEGRTMGFNDWKYSSPVTKDADGKWVDDSTWNPVSGYLRKFDDEQNFSQLYPALDADGNPTLKQFIGTKAQARQAQVAALNTFGPAELNDGLLLSFAKGLSNTLASTDDILIGALKMRSTGHRWFNKAVLGAMGHSEEESDLYSRIFAFDKFADDKLAAIHQNILDDTETNSYTGSQASENFGSLDWLSGGVAAAAGSLLQFGGVGRGIRLATSIANYGAKTLGTELLKREAASLISTYGSSAIIGFGAGYNEGKTNGLSDNEAFAFALPVGLINTVLEAKLGAGVDKYLIGGHKNIAKELFNETGGKVADKAALGKAINKVSEKLSASIAKDMAKDTGQNVAEEVLQEMNGQLFRSAFNAFLPGTKGEGKFRESGFDGEALASAGIFGGVSSAPMSYLAAKSEARSFGKDPDSVISGYVEQGQSETLLLGLDTLLAKKLITPEQHKEKTSRILDYRNVEQEILSKKINFGNEYSSVLKREFTNLSVEKSLLERQKMSLLESAAEAMAAGGADAAKIKRETTAKIAEIDANLAELSVVIPLYENPAFIAARTKKVQAFVEKQRNDNPFAGRTPFAARIASLFSGKAEKVAAAGMAKTVVPEAVVPDISTPEELRAVLDAIHGGDADAAMLIDVEWLNKNPIYLSDMFDDRDLEELGMMGVLIPVKPTNAATPPVLANDIASQLAAAELAIEKKRRASLEKAENDSNPQIEKWKKTAEEEVARMGKLTLATDNTIGALTGSLFNEKERINKRHDKELSDLRAQAAVAQAAVAQAAAEKAAAAQAAAALAATPRPLVLANAAPQDPASQAAAPQIPVAQTPVAQTPAMQTPAMQAPVAQSVIDLFLQALASLKSVSKLNAFIKKSGITPQLAKSADQTQQVLSYLRPEQQELFRQLRTLDPVPLSVLAINSNSSEKQARYVRNLYTAFIQFDFAKLDIMRNSPESAANAKKSYLKNGESYAEMQDSLFHLLMHETTHGGFDAQITRLHKQASQGDIDAQRSWKRMVDLATTAYLALQTRRNTGDLYFMSIGDRHMLLKGKKQRDNEDVFVHEFFAEALSNREMMNHLSAIRIDTKDAALSAIIGSNYGYADTPPRTTLWNEVVKAVLSVFQSASNRLDLETRTVLAETYALASSILSPSAPPAQLPDANTLEVLERDIYAHQPYALFTFNEQINAADLPTEIQLRVKAFNLPSDGSFDSKLRTTLENAIGENFVEGSFRPIFFRATNTYMVWWKTPNADGTEDTQRLFIDSWGNAAPVNTNVFNREDPVDLSKPAMYEPFLVSNLNNPYWEDKRQVLNDFDRADKEGFVGESWLRYDADHEFVIGQGTAHQKLVRGQVSIMYRFPDNSVAVIGYVNDLAKIKLGRLLAAGAEVKLSLVRRPTSIGSTLLVRRDAQGRITGTLHRNSPMAGYRMETGMFGMVDIRYISTTATKAMSDAGIRADPLTHLDPKVPIALAVEREPDMTPGEIIEDIAGQNGFAAEEPPNEEAAVTDFVLDNAVAERLKNNMEIVFRRARHRRAWFGLEENDLFDYIQNSGWAAIEALKKQYVPIYGEQIAAKLDYFGFTPASYQEWVRQATDRAIRETVSANQFQDAQDWDGDGFNPINTISPLIRFDIERLMYADPKDGRNRIMDFSDASDLLYEATSFAKDMEEVVTRLEAISADPGQSQRQRNIALALARNYSNQLFHEKIPENERAVFAKAAPSIIAQMGSYRRSEAIIFQPDANSNGVRSFYPNQSQETSKVKEELARGPEAYVAMLQARAKAEGKKASGFLWTITNKIFGLTRDDISGDDAKEKFSGVKVLRLISRYLNDETLLRQEGAKAYFDSLNEKERRFMSRFVNPETGLFVETADKDGYNELAGLLEGFLREVGLDEFPFHLMERQRIDDNEAYIKRETEAFKERMSLKNSEEYQEFLLGMPTEEEKTARQKAILVEYNRKMLRFRSDVRQKSPSHTYRTTVFSRNLQQGDDKVKTASLERSAPVIELAAQTAQFLYTAIEKIAEGENTTIGRRVGELVAVAQTVQDYRSDKQTPAFYLDASQTKRWSRRIRNWTDDLMHRLSFNTGGLLSAYRNTNMYRDNNLVRAIANSAGKPVDAYFAGLKTAEGTDGTTYTEMDDADYLYSMLAGFVTSPGRYWHFDKTPSDKPGNYMYRLAKIEPRQYAAEVNKLKDMEETRMERASARFSEAFRPVYQLGENGKPVRDPETKAFIFERYEVKDQNALESMVEDADYTLKDGVYGKGRLHDRSKYWYGGGSTQEVLAKLEAEADMFYRMLLDDGISIPVSQAFENEHNPYMTQARAAKEGVAFELEEKVVRNYAMNLENERKSIARQWYVNQTINQFHVSMVIQGDPLYYKGAVDGSKRMAGARAPFQHSNAEGTFNMAALRDIDRGRTDVEFPVLSINDDGSISISAPQKVAESNRSDAQGYVTEDFAKRLTEINGSLAGYGNVFKPIQFGIQPQHLEDARPTYLKLSMFVVPDPYKPEHAAYYQSQPGMLGMAMKMYSVDGPNPVDVVLFESGIKTGISNLSNHSDAQWKTQPMSLSMFGFQNNPRHLTDDHTDISGMSQGKKISHNMSPRLSLEALEIESKIIRAKMEAAFETFTPEGVAAIAKDSLSRQRHTAEMAKVLDSGISVDNPVFGVMVENLVNARLAEASSYVRLPGNKLVNASEVGFQRPALTPEQQQRYEAVAKAIGDTVLRWAGPRKPDGLLPFQLEEFSAGLADGSMQLDGDGTILGIDPDTKSFVPVIYPAEVLVSSTMGAVGEKMIAMRIPTSGPQSIIPCVIAGHLPPELVSGNIIVSPSEGPGLLGFDFDVDGLGTWRRSGNAQMNKLFDLYYRMYTNPRVYSDITSPIDTGIFDALLSDDSLAAADNESRLLGRQSSEWDDSSPMKQIMFRNLNSIGKIFIGISAVANNIHNILSGSKKNGHTVRLIPTRKKKRVIERTIRIAGENAGSYESHYTDLETGEVKPIAPILVSMINLATDNAKLQKLFRLGLTLENAAVFFDFVLKGIDPKAALYFINQPIVRQFEKASMAEKRMSSKYAGSDPYRDMVAMYEREMEVLTGNEYTHVSIFDNPRYQIDKDISYDDLKRMLAMDNDAREQKAPSPLTDNADYIRMQLLVLDKYRYYQRLQNKTKKIGSIIRMDSTYPKTFLQAAKRYQDTLKSFEDTNFKTLVVSQKPEDFEHFDKEDWRSRLIVKQILDEMNLTKAHPILEMHYEGLEKMIDRYSEIKIIASHEVFHHLWPYISSLQEGDQVKVENALKANVVSSFSDYNNRLLGKQMDSYHFVDQSSRMIAALVNDPEYADNSFLKLLSADIMFEPDHERIVSQQSRPSSIKANTIGREFSAAEIERLHADYYALPTAYASGEFDSPLDMQKILVANMLLQKGLGMGGFSFTHLLPIPIIQELDNTVKDFRNSHPGYQNLFAGNFADRLLGMFQFMQIDIKPDQVEGLRVALTKAKDKTDVDVSKLVDGRGNRNFNILWDNWPTNRAIRITNRDGSKSLYQRTSYLDFDDQTGSVYMVHKIVRIAMPKQYFVQEIPIQESLADWTERWNERQKNGNAELVPDGNSSIAKIISSSTSKEETEETDDELMSEAISRHMENRAPQKPQKPQSLRELQQELDDDYRKSRDEETREIRGVIREREEKERREEKARVEEEKARRANDTILKVLNLFTTSPIQQIDFKKSKAKASVATKYVGFGNPGSGISSTHQYMLDAGEYANTGSYAAEDIVFLSVSGNRKSDTMVGANLELTKSEIDKVIAAGARIVKDNNRPSAFNTGEQMMSQYLVSKGYQYSETSVDGQVLGLWSPPAIRNIPVKQQAANTNTKNTPQNPVGDRTTEQIDKAISQALPKFLPDMDIYYYDDLPLGLTIDEQVLLSHTLEDDRSATGDEARKKYRKKVLTKEDFDKAKIAEEIYDWSVFNDYGNILIKDILEQVEILATTLKDRFSELEGSSFRKFLEDFDKGELDDHREAAENKLKEYGLFRLVAVPENNPNQTTMFGDGQQQAPNPPPVKQQAPVVPVSPLIPLSKEQSDAIKYIFKQYPELESLFGGNENLYQQYIESVFPGSKIKDIVYHSTNAQFDEFQPTKPNFDTLNSIEGIYNFTSSREFSTRYGGITLSVLLNTNKPHHENTTGEYVDDMDRPLSEGLFKLGMIKTPNPAAPLFDENLVGSDAIVNTISGERYVEKHPVSGQEIGTPAQIVVTVFKPEQIHILGGKRDLEQAQRFVAGNAKANATQLQTNLKPVFRIPMNFEDGTGGRKMLPQFKGKSTLELIKEGYRTATSRDRTKPYSQQNIKVGDIIEFYADSGKSKGQSVLVRITKAPYKLSEISAQEWSKLEGWEPSKFEKLKSEGYDQFRYELIEQKVATQPFAGTANPENAVPVRKPSGIRQISRPVKSSKKTEFTGYRRKERKTTISGYRLTIPEFPDAELYLTKEFVTQDSVEGSTEFNGKTSYWEIETRTDKGVILPIPVQGRSTIEETIDGFTKYINELHSRGGTDLKVLRSVGIDLDEYDGGSGDGGNVLRFSSQPLPGDVDFDEDADAEDGVRILEYYAKVVGFAERDTPMDDMSLAETVIRYRFGEAANAIWAVNSTFDPNTVYDVNYINFGKKPPAPYTYQEMIDEMMGGYRAEEAYLFDLSDRINNQDMLGTDANGNYITSVDDLALLHSQLAQNYNTADGLAKREFAGVFKKVADELAKRRVKRHVTYNGIPQELVENQRDLGRFSDYTTSIAEMSGYQLALQASSKMVDRAKYLSDSETNKTVGKLRILLSDVYKAHFASQSDAWHRKFAFWNNHNRHNEPYLWLYEKDPQERYTGNFIQRTSNGKTTNEFMQMERQSKLNTVEGELARAKLALYSFLEATGNDLLTQNDYTNVPTDRAFMPHLAVSMEEAYARNGLVGAYMEAAGVNDYNEVLDKVFVTLPSGTKAPSGTPRKMALGDYRAIFLDGTGTLAQQRAKALSHMSLVRQAQELVSNGTSGLSGYDMERLSAFDSSFATHSAIPFRAVMRRKNFSVNTTQILTQHFTQLIFKKHHDPVLSELQAVRMHYEMKSKNPKDFENISKFIELYSNRYLFGKKDAFASSTAGKMLEVMSTVTTASFLGFAPANAALNLLGGAMEVYKNNIENYGWAEGTTRFAIGQKRLFEKGTRKPNDATDFLPKLMFSPKALALAERYNLENFSQIDTEQEGSTWATYTKFALQIQRSSEIAVRLSAFLGELTQAQWDNYYLDNNGILQVTDPAIAPKIEDVNEWKYYVSTKQGFYDPAQKYNYSYYGVAKGVMLFKNWVLSYMKERFYFDPKNGQANYSDIDRYGKMRQGYYITLAMVAKDLAMQVKTFRGVLDKSELNAMEAANLRKCLFDLGMLVTLVALGNLGDDDEEDGYWTKFVNKLNSQLYFALIPSEWVKMVKQPTPSLAIVENILSSVSNLAQGKAEKTAKNLMNAIPGGNLVEGAIELQESLQED